MSTSKNRREVLKDLGLGMITLALPGFKSSPKPDKTHIITLSFDDGFRKSSLKTAEIYEKHNLSACINVIASAHFKDYVIRDAYQHVPVGDFQLWNELQARGHEIMPHGYQHTNLVEIPFEEAKDLVKRCLELFDKELKGFEPKKAIFNFPYNASNPEIEEWLGQQVMAFRTSGAAVNALPYAGQKKLTCISYGPGSIEEFLEAEINKFLGLPSGWFIFNTHGLDGEGWGPMTSVFLDKLLGRLVQLKHVWVAPAGVVVSRG